MYLENRTTNVSSHVVKLLGAFVVAAVIGCGGGTTGTSPTDSLKFSGFAEQADGTRAGSLTMSVRSTSTDETLVDSGTNEEGRFDMELPSEESSFTVDVSGVGSARVNRNQNGAGAMSAKLSVTSQGALSIAEFFENQVISACPSISVRGTKLIISGEVGKESCPIEVITASSELFVQNFTARVLATCAGAATVVSSASASPTGAMTLDLNEAFSKGCVDISVVVTTPDAVGLESVFTVE
jgi:hypothetical protein